MTNVEIPNGLPILSVGSHERGSGRACIMNAISYLRGDSDITDYPACVHPILAQAAQMINDSICNEPVKDKMGEEVLCPSCAHQVWLFGSRLMGTGVQELKERHGDLHARETAWVNAFVDHVQRVFGTKWTSVDIEPDMKLGRVLSAALSAIAVKGWSSGKPVPLPAEQSHLALGYKLLDLFNEIVDPTPREVVEWSEETYETVTTEGRIPAYTK
jgi:hypothetical protein